MEAYIVPATRTHTHTVIFLHEMNSTGEALAHNFFRACGNFSPQHVFPNLKWIFPSSPKRKSCHSGDVFPQWFEMWNHSDPNNHSHLQRPGLSAGVFDLHQIIDTENAFIPLDHIILAGIGQGCAMAIFSFLCGGLRLGGFIGISGWLPFAEYMFYAHDIAYSQGWDILINAHAKGQAHNYAYSHASQLQLSPGSQGERASRGEYNEDSWGASSVRNTPVFVSNLSKDMLVANADGLHMCSVLASLGFRVEERVYNSSDSWFAEPRGTEHFLTFLAECMRNSPGC